MINNLNLNKAPGIDDIPTTLVRASRYRVTPKNATHLIQFQEWHFFGSPYVISPYLTKMINYCFENACYFDELKIARVMPLHKGGPKLIYTTSALYQYYHL